MIDLKHIAPYIPYGVEGLFTLSSVANIPKHKDEERIKLMTEDNIAFFRSFCKLILRPLSDLDKDITHNGKTFNPVKELVELTKSSNALIAFYGLNTVGLADYLEDVANYGNINPKYLSYPLAQKLMEWHFDIHGLIERGLAIDINELNKIK